jgi:hypothetical protein
MLVLRQHVGFDIGNLQSARDRFRRPAIVAGQHDDAHTVTP